MCETTTERGLAYKISSNLHPEERPDPLRWRGPLHRAPGEVEGGGGGHDDDGGADQVGGVHAQGEVVEVGGAAKIEGLPPEVEKVQSIVSIL